MPKNKLQAVYELREAAEEHGRIEQQIETDRSPANIDRLLDAKERLELKTVEAISACEHCGLTHCGDESHQRKTNVINVEFGTQTQGEAGRPAD